METAQLISIDEFCIHYKSEISSTPSHHEFRLMDSFAMDELQFIIINHLHELEKFKHLQ